MAINGNQWQSVAISDHQWQSVAISDHHVEAPPMQLNELRQRGHQRPSEATGGHQEAINDTLTCSLMCSVVNGSRRSR